VKVTAAAVTSRRRRLELSSTDANGSIRAMFQRYTTRTGDPSSPQELEAKVESTTMEVDAAQQSELQRRRNRFGVHRSAQIGDDVGGAVLSPR